MGEQHFFAPGETRPRLVDQEHHRPVATVEVRSADGRLLTPAETEVAMSSSE